DLRLPEDEEFVETARVELRVGIARNFLTRMQVLDDDTDQAYSLGCVLRNQGVHRRTDRRRPCRGPGAGLGVGRGGERDGNPWRRGLLRAGGPWRRGPLRAGGPLRRAACLLLFGGAREPPDGARINACE